MLSPTQNKSCGDLAQLVVAIIYSNNLATKVATGDVKHPHTLWWRPFATATFLRHIERLLAYAGCAAWHAGICAGLSRESFGCLTYLRHSHMKCTHT